ncbi:SET domain-containing protein [Massarina eburnea CBS 473.64]|uniref:SET domain-containing protein n=1 Tax=Massarina eburnea CBS 473.64 TaxID=1395130 RepID=A0A6A6RG29_9PLEO|nr:SET domain-containing protein [Massarina eburnea CBS 473.64]
MKTHQDEVLATLRTFRRMIGIPGNMTEDDKRMFHEYLERLYEPGHGPIFFYVQDKYGFPRHPPTRVTTTIGAKTWNPELMTENTFDADRWVNWTQPDFYGANKRPQSLKECLGDPNPLEQCVACRSLEACTCTYKEYKRTARNGWLKCTNIQRIPDIGFFGLFAHDFITQGTILDEYSGELVPHDDTVSDDESSYWSSLPCGPRPNPANHVVDGEQVPRPHGHVAIDSRVRGSAVRFMNHSCVPNAALFEGRAGTERRLVFVEALRDIWPEEEITIDYGLDWTESMDECLCGEVECRKPGKDSMELS